MDHTEFKTLIETYGATPERWPAELRADALACRDASPEARALLRAAAGLDRLLDAERAPALPRLTVDAIVMRAAAQPQPRSAPAPRRSGGFLSSWFGDLRVAGWAAAVVLGFVIGWSAPFDTDNSADAASMIDLLTDSSYEDLPW